MKEERSEPLHNACLYYLSFSVVNIMQFYHLSYCGTSAISNKSLQTFNSFIASCKIFFGAFIGIAGDIMFYVILFFSCNIMLYA